MGWKFYGYAAVYGTPGTDGDVFTHHCFAEFLQTPGHLSIPMLNAHTPQIIGRWLRFVETGHGLLVWGETSGEAPPDPSLVDPPARYPLGLSVTPINAKGPAIKNCWGGNTCRIADLAEISIVGHPVNPGARILGEWSDLPG